MFEQLTQAPSPLEEAYVKSYLQKWDMIRGSRFLTFSYNKYYHAMQAKEFVSDLFNEPSFQAVFQVPLKNGAVLPLTGTVTEIEAEVVPCTLTGLHIFDKLSEGDPCVARENGDLVKCMDDNIDGFQISDALRDLLLNEDSELAGLYSDDEKAQFLWRLFEHMCLGGPCCQFEDNVRAYLEVTKKLYKSLVSVQKNTTTCKVETTSIVYKVKLCTTDTGFQLFSSPSRNSFCYIVRDPLRRTAKLLYHCFMPYW